MLDSEKTREQLIAELEELRNNEALYRKLSSLSFDFTHRCIKHDFDGYRIDWLGGAVEKVTGYSHEEMYACGCWLKIIHPDDLTRVGAHLMALQDCDSGEIEFRIIHKNGKIRFIREFYSCEFDDYTKKFRLYGSTMDITTRKQAEEALKKSAERLRRAELVAGTGNWELDLSNRTIHASKGARSIYGLWDETLTLADIQKVSLPEYRPLLKKTFQALVENSEPYSVEFKIRRPSDGKILDVSSTATYDEGCNMIFGIIQDITERTRIQEVLVQTEKMMSVGGLAAGMAHEINNPLSGILQNVQVLVRRLTDDSLINADAASDVGCSFQGITQFMNDRGILVGLEHIRESGARAAQIVKSMLEFSRRSESVNAPANVNALIDKAVELSSADYDLIKQYDFRNISLVREYSSDLPDVPCFKTQIQQVFVNLFCNAAHAMTGMPTPKIIVRTCRDGDSVRIEIEDNGPGMDEGTRQKIFEPFYTTKPIGMGTGLGLSVSYFIIKNNHRGMLDVQSAPGRGARFIVRLPISKDVAEA